MGTLTNQLGINTQVFENNWIFAQNIWIFYSDTPLISYPDDLIIFFYNKQTFVQVKFNPIMTGNWNRRGGHAVFPGWSVKAVSKGAWLKPVVLFSMFWLNRIKLLTWSKSVFSTQCVRQLIPFDCQHSHSPWAYRIVGIYIHKTYRKFGA